MAGLINKEDELARLAKEVAKIEGGSISFAFASA
jgi:hypothetical protein